jgi:hypothetical protein
LWRTVRWSASAPEGMGEGRLEGPGSGVLVTDIEEVHNDIGNDEAGE